MTYQKIISSLIESLGTMKLDKSINIGKVYVKAMMKEGDKI